MYTIRYTFLFSSLHFCFSKIMSVLNNSKFLSRVQTLLDEAEGVKIESSGAEKLLNSKAAYSRNKIPRIIAVDSPEMENLGEMF